MNTTKIIETVAAAAAVVGIITVLPFTGVLAAGLLVVGGLTAMAALETKERNF